MSSNTYTRQDLGSGAILFDVLIPHQPNTTMSIIAGVFVGLFCWFVVAPFFSGLSVIVGAGMGWWGYKWTTQWEEANAAQKSGTPAVTINVSAEGLMVGPTPAFGIPRAEITSLVWKDWSSNDTDPSTSHALYVDTKDASQIIYNGFDRQTVTRLASEISTALGGVPVEGNQPLTQQPQGTAAAKQQAARAMLEGMREEFAKTMVTSEMQPLAPGDLVLQETAPNKYEIQQVMESGRILHKEVPSTDFSEALAFAEKNADGRNLWLSKLVDKGPLVLIRGRATF